ncbi:MAG: TonB-dependent receptor [bacterium]|nr:TonB-dependent receptor [bacterium]
MKKCLIVLAVVMLLVSSGYAIEQFGVIDGSVHLDDGKTIPGVSVTAESSSLMGNRVTVTNENGYYRISRLNVGMYVLTFELEGFKKVIRKNVLVELAKTTTADILMEMGSISEEIQVIASFPVVDMKSSTNQVNISKKMVETLANDRQYQTIMEMMPGAIPGNNPSMMGAADSDNMYQMDGMESTDPYTKTWTGQMNFDNFEEMQVIAQGATAEYGRGTGAVINVITKSGGNRLSGTARLNLSKVDWNASSKGDRNNFDDNTHFLNETRPAINLGGPIIKDHIWFFGSYERRNKWKPATWYTSSAEALNNTPTGAGKGYYEGHYASMKTTLNFGNFSVMGTWSEDPITMPEYYKYTNSTSRAFDNDLTKTQGGWKFNAEANTTLGKNTYMVARFAMRRGTLDMQSHVQEGTRYLQSGYYWGAGYYDYKSSRDFNQYTVNVSHFMDTSFGYHDIKVGAEYLDINIVSPINYSYPGGEFIKYNDDGETMYKRVYDTDVPKQVEAKNAMTTLFFQDKWEVTGGLTLNIGLRFEGGTWKNHAGDTIMDFGLMDMFAPRLGIVYSFGKNKFHANWGRFFDAYGFYMVNNFQPAIFYREYDYYRGQHYGYDDWTYIRTTVDTSAGDSATKADSFDPQHMDEVSVGYERVLSDKLSLSISYMHRAWKDKIEDYDLDGDGNWHFANETDFHDQTTNWGKTYKKYDAVMFSIKKNLGEDKFQFMTSYTWAKLKGFSDNDGEGGYADDPYEWVNSLGFLENDVRHQFKFYGSYLLPFDVNLGVNFYWFSGQPYTDKIDMRFEDTTGESPGHDGEDLDYYVDPRGTTGRYPGTWRLDLRVEKKFSFKNKFSISVYADVFNVLNQQVEVDRKNKLGDGVLLGPVGGDFEITYNDGTYGQYVEWFAPTAIFLGAKIEF